MIDCIEKGRGERKKNETIGLEEPIIDEIETKFFDSPIKYYFIVLTNIETLNFR